jgi:hypothetical protein
MRFSYLSSIFRRHWYWALVLLACGLASGLASRGNGDPVAMILSIAVLIITAVTLSYVVPTPAVIWVDPHDELELSDLIFYVTPQPAVPGDQQIPRDILLQLHVAVSNTGGRKAVLSSGQLTAFLDENGNMIKLPEVPIPLRAERYGVINRYTAGNEMLEVMSDPGPWVLEPDDVITLRFRFRRGIDWSDRWNLEELRRIYDGYMTDVRSVTVQAVYRKGRTAEHRNFRIPIKVEQQKLYTQCLKEVTADFTVRPALPVAPFKYE